MDNFQRAASECRRCFRIKRHHKTPDFTVSDNASAAKCRPSAALRHVILHHTIKATVVENDGEVFKATDWARLKKIAEGNPDETKIGAFGVGFYSVFADCEEPFVSSGREALAFHWKGDALYTKRLRLPNDETTRTTFMLPLRNTSLPVPNLLSLSQFLTNSLTFVGLQSIDLWVDDWRILTLMKKLAPGVPINIPRELSRKTQDGLLHIESVLKEAAQVDATWLRAIEWKPKVAQQSESDGSSHGSRAPESSRSLRTFFSRLAPSSSKSEALERQAKMEREAQAEIGDSLLNEERATLFVHVNKAILRTATSKSFSSELERATKKPPPKMASIALLSASYDEVEASSINGGRSNQSLKIFEFFIPEEGKGRIFIGFTTNQTTGLSIHISTPSVIPTVEREAIDLNNRFVRQWNVEMLRAAGIVARISWGQEMSDLGESLSQTARGAGRSKILNEDISKVLPAALHLHNSFSWSETTPSSEVGLLMEEPFWTCNRKVAIATLSSKGVMPSSQIRREVGGGLGFVEGIPIVPPALAQTRLVQKLFDYGVVVEINVSDIGKELENKALNAEQLRLFLVWLAHKLQINEFDKAAVKALLDVAVANDDENDEGGLLILSEMKTFVNTSRIPASMPVPPSTLPFNFTKKITRQDLTLLGFDDLQMVPWLRWIVESRAKGSQDSPDHEVTRDAGFAGQVLAVVSKQWEGLSQSSKATIVELLSQHTVIPTKMGMRKPKDAYVANVKLFDDLPTVTPTPAVKEKFLVALGVRKTVELSVIFERLMDNSSVSTSPTPNSVAKWSHYDLIKYLMSIRADIPKEDIARLKSTKICPAVAGHSRPTQERFLLSELFEPTDELEELGLPTMHWPAQYRPQSDEGKFLTSLGLRSAPKYPELIDIMHKSALSQDSVRRDRAMKFFIDHHQTNGYAAYDANSVSTPYLPIQGSEKKIATPAQVFVNERATILGFDILRRDLQVHALKFGVKQDPPIQECIKRLVTNPPADSRTARQVFTYMASRVGDLSRQDKDSLSDAPIIPLPPRSTETTLAPPGKPWTVRHGLPRMCFLGSGEQFADIFDFVDFGHEANAFLLACGSKHEPSTVELTKRLIAEPATIYSVLGDVRYLDLLRSIATAWKNLKKDKSLVRDLKAANCLLAYREMFSSAETEQEEDYEEDSGVKLWQLAPASKIIIIDDFNVFNNFRSGLLAAPQEDGLEDFYYSLGASPVSALLEVLPRLGPRARDQALAGKLQRLILERTRLFLNDYSQEKIKHNYAWLQKHLMVECVQSIAVRWSLRGYKVVKDEFLTAMVPGDKPALYITAGEYNFVDISQALVPLLLHRANPNAVYMLEMFLQSSLKQLRSRGYNVDRILRAKAAEARIAEEARTKQVEEERQRIKEQEEDWKRTQATTLISQDKEDSQMPGIFPSSPEHGRGTGYTVADDQLVPQSRKGGLFSGISRHFNLENVKRGFGQSQNHLPVQSRTGAGNIEPDAPPPYSPERKQQQITQAPPPESVTAPHHLQRNLINAVQVSRNYASNQLESQPTVTEVKETSTYCDRKPAQNIRFIGAVGSLRVFLSNDVIANDPSTIEKFVLANTTALSQFANVLLDCANAFSLCREAVHIFYDVSGSTIGFNQSNALFFNYRYFENLHLPQVQQGNLGDAIVYWAVVMAHELAHNLVSDHSAEHSFYTESLIAQYFSKIAKKAGDRIAACNTAPRLQDPLLPQPA